MELPDKIEEQEQHLEEIMEQLNNPENYKDPRFDAKSLGQKMKDLEEEIANLYQRWETLAEFDQ